MKFRFCGDLDCPDWVLAEISTLSKLSSIKVKLLCTQVFKNLLGEDVDYDKVMKLTNDSKFKLNDVKACMAVITLILSNATKYAVDANSLSNELQQLGMPKEHAAVLCKGYEENVNALREEFHKKSFKLAQLESVDWKVDYILGSNESNCEPILRVKLLTHNPGIDKLESSPLTMTSEKLLLLLDVTNARSVAQVNSNLITFPKSRKIWFFIVLALVHLTKELKKAQKIMENL